MGTWSTIGEFAGDPHRIEFDGPVRSLRLNAVAGRIDVVGTDGPPSIEVTRATEQPLRITLEDGVLVVRHGDENKPGIFNWLRSGRRMTAEVTLALPPDALLDVKLVSGPVTVTNFHERVDVKGVSGDVTLAEVHGSAAVRTVSGAVTAEQVTGDLSLRAVSGSITVIGAATGSLEATAVSGAIMIDVEDPVPSGLKVQCVSGAITVRLPHDPDVTVDLTTSNGRIASSFPQIGVTAAGPGGPRRMSGRIGSGDAHLSGKTVSGSVTLLRRAKAEDGDGPEDARPGGEPFFGSVPRDAAPDHGAADGGDRFANDDHEDAR